MKDLLQYIPIGEQNAISTHKLRALAGFSNNRALTIAIHDLRENGSLICSNTRGYFIPATPAEAAHFIRSMYSRIRKMRQAVRAIEKYAENGEREKFQQMLLLDD
ncbi:MAG: hypothetical protein ACI39E_00245 [Acutalibacteraceae bacterium]